MFSKFIIFFLISFSAYGSFPEFFGAGVQNGSLGNQMSFDYTNPAHNFYVPASLAWNKNVNVSASTTIVKSTFHDINNIVTKNSTNNSDAPLQQSGNVDTDYGSHEHAGINASIPIKTFGNFGISVFTPITTIMETNSGNAHLPEYVLHRSRYKRTQAYFNYAHKLNDTMAFSLGAHMGFQAGANVDTRAALNGTGYGSSATAKTQVDPSIAAIASYIHRYKENTHFYFTFQQEMKNNLESDAVGFTANPPVPFDVTIKTMIYYDPHIFRFGAATKTRFFQFFTSLEYQIWDGYQTPIVRIKANGGSLAASDDYESVETSNILVSKFGVRYNPTDKLGLNIGTVYRPSIFSHGYSGSGNSLDLNTVIVSGGLDYKFNFMSMPIQLDLGMQYHKLLDETITKSTNQEDGTAGSKIGSPGYEAGGSVIMLASGIKLEF
ncbi:MAG: hypothetical protein KC493_06110 [Bacteriovoracaceae bacterium]|nr:hypothetical protein [Bacteriovoracaceae bacterium]